MDTDDDLRPYSVTFAVEVEASSAEDAARIYWDVLIDYMNGLGPGTFRARPIHGGPVEYVTLAADVLTRGTL